MCPSSLQTEQTGREQIPPCRRSIIAHCLKTFLELQVKTFRRAKLLSFPCLLPFPHPSEWREIYSKLHSWTVIYISQEGEGKNGLTGRDRHKERYNGGGKDRERDDEEKTSALSAEKTATREQRVKSGFKRPHSCRCLCCCARKLLSLEESKNACVVMSLSHVMFSFGLSCFFFTTDSWINQSIQDGHGPTSSWKDHVAFFGMASVEMTAAFVGESLSGRGIFHTPFKAVTFVTQCKPHIVVLLAARNVGRFTSSKGDYYSVQTVETVLNHKEDA